MASHQCHSCGAPVEIDEPVPRDSECEGCGADLRACINCRHYDPAYHNSCRETEAEMVEDKRRRNFCEYFSFTREPFRSGAGQAGRAADARAKLEGLFGGGGAGTPGIRQSEAREKLDDLFRKPGERKK